MGYLSLHDSEHYPNTQEGSTMADETPSTTTTPPENSGSGQFAVYDEDLGQYVSGVSSKADADKARKSLESHNGAITDGHKLVTREV